MPLNSKQKGARGEREFAKWLRDNLGVDARRGQQFKGTPESPDVIAGPGIHFEVKRVENLNLAKAMEQAVNDSNAIDCPAVAHRKNRTPWLITFRASDIHAFYRWLSLYKKGPVKDNVPSD